MRVRVLWGWETIKEVLRVIMIVMSVVGVLLRERWRMRVVVVVVRV